MYMLPFLCFDMFLLKPCVRKVVVGYGLFSTSIAHYKKLLTILSSLDYWAEHIQS